MTESRQVKQLLVKKAARRRRANPETGLTSAVLQLFAYHPEVAWAERINTGATVIGKRFIRFGFTGCADVIGQMKRRGAFLAIETKDQREYLAKVARAGGCSGVARSVDDAQRVILDWVKDQALGQGGQSGHLSDLSLPSSSGVP